MKRIFIIIAMAIVAFATAIAQNPGIALSSNGKMQFFTKSQLAEAIEAAQPNDTIWLSSGEYSNASLPAGPRNLYLNSNKISKPVVIIGAGADVNSVNCSAITGNTLALGAPSGTDIVLEGVALYDGICAASDCSVTLRNCKFQFITPAYDEVADKQCYFQNLCIDRCKVGRINDGLCRGLAIGAGINTSVTNSEIEFLTATTDNHDITNCYIEKVSDGKSGEYDTSFAGTIRNSFISEIADLSSITYINSYFDMNYDTIDKATYINSHSAGIYGPVRNNLNNRPENAVELGFVGTDGTAAGSYGGETPFTLNPSYPTADLLKTTITNDKTTRKLKVKVSTLGK